MVGALMTGPDRQIRLLGAHGVFTYPFACIPFLFFYFKAHGLDLGQYLWLIAWYYWAMVLMEVPTGIIADRFGRRLSLIAGSSILAAAFFTIYCGRGFGTFCAGEVLFGVGHALLSGTPTAFLFDSLKGRGQSDGFLVAESRIHALRLFGTGGSFLAGGVIAYVFGIEFTILCTGLLCLVGAVIAGFLHEERRAGDGSLPLLRSAFSDLRSAPLIWILVYFVLLFGLLRFAFHTYQPYFEVTVFDWEHPERNWLTLGVLFGVLNLVAAPCSRLAPRLIGRFRYGPIFFWLPTTMCGTFLVMAALPNWLGVLLFFVHQIPFGLHWSIIQEFVNRRVATESRATALSIVSLVGRVSFAAWIPLVGIYEKEHGMAVTYWFVGVVGLVLTVLWCAPMLGGRLFVRTSR